MRSSKKVQVKKIHLNSKDGSDVINPLSPPRLLRHVEGSGDEILLLVLDGHHLVLDGLVSDVLVDEHVLVLAESVHPVEALPLTRRVPGRVQKQEVIGRGKIETNPTGLESRTLRGCND